MIKLLCAALTGAISVLAFAPFGWWVLIFPSLAWLIVTLYNTSDSRQCTLIGYCYGLGLFGAGVYWIYYSLHLFGAAIAPLAALGTFLFVAAAACYPALFAGLLARCRRTPITWFLLYAPALWLLVEWFRSWFLTGFPWLSAGYTTIQTPLAGFAPVGGVYLNSLLVVIISGAVGLVVVSRSARSVIVAVVVIGALGFGGRALQEISWTQESGEPVSVTMVQGNIEQELKFVPSLIEDSLRTYASLSQTDSDLIIWPESAIPTLYSDVALWEEEFAAQMRTRGSVVLSGGFLANDDYTEFYNAIKVLGGTPAQQYTKRHLVPFGEFIPFRDLLTLLANLIQIPMSDLSPGQGPLAPIEINGVSYGMSICYEDAFGAEMIAQFPRANVLVNVSNDAWFGDSTAPHQHLELAAMRSLEFQRPMLRATNTGISALISHQGKILQASDQFTESALQVSVAPRRGETLFVRVGNMLVVSLAVLMLLAAFVISRRSQPCTG